MSGLGGIPSAWRSPTTRCPGGNILAPLSAELAMLAPRAPGGSPRGGRWDATPRPPAGLDARDSHPGGLPGCGAASARVGSATCVRHCADANLLTSDYQLRSYLHRLRRGTLSHLRGARFVSLHIMMEVRWAVPRYRANLGAVR
jgi:hypothetical protein